MLLDENSHAQPLFSCTAIRDTITIMYNTVNNSINIALFANHAMAFLCVHIDGIGAKAWLAMQVRAHSATILIREKAALEEGGEWGGERA